MSRGVKSSQEELCEIRVTQVKSRRVINRVQKESKVIFASKYAQRGNKYENEPLRWTILKIR